MTVHLFSFASIFTVATCVSFCFAQIWNEVHLNAVTHFEGIDAYYRTLRQQIPGMENPPTESSKPRERARIKKKLCQHIFGSHFFRMHRLEWVNTDGRAIREYLRNNLRDTFYTMYNEYEYRDRFLRTTGYGYDYANAYRTTRVRMGDEEVEEYVFSCVARNRSSGTLKEYFISRAYNVNLLDIYAYPIAARFVFSTNNTNNEALTMVAMAEESANEWDLARQAKLVVPYYVLLRWKEVLADTPDLDPVCSLSPGQKLRLCAIFFGLSWFKDKIRFEPTINNVDLDCVRKEVSIVFVSGSRHFQEWVIGCKANETRTNSPITFYVSSGDEENSIFVYRDARRGQKIYLHNVCQNLSMVGKRVRPHDHGDDDQQAVPRNETRGRRFLQMDVEI